MATAKSHVHILAPGLLGPMPGVVDLDAPPEPKTLRQLLDRSRITDFATASYESTLFGLFGIDAGVHDLPLAALSRLGDGGAVDERCWVQLNPVFLRPDQGRLLLFDTLDLDFDLAQARALGALFMEHFSGQGWQLEVVTPHRWYLTMESVPEIRTSAIEQVFGRSIDRFLPTGNDALYWHGMMNEVQMLFHGAETNRQREQRGQLPVSGVWISGIGCLPGMIKPRVGMLFSDSGLAWGLARHAGIDYACLPEQLQEFPGDDSLYVFEEMQRPVWRADPFDWHAALERFQDWLEPCVDGLRSGTIDTLFLYPCDGRRYQISRGLLRRFWRTGMPFTRRLMENRSEDRDMR